MISILFGTLMLGLPVPPLLSLSPPPPVCVCDINQQLTLALQ